MKAFSETGSTGLANDFQAVFCTERARLRVSEANGSATIRDVSRLARVSMSTVSRVLNGNVPVAADTRERVLKAVEQLNYRPNAFARSLATNRSGGVGVIVNEMTSPYYGVMVRGVEQVLEPECMHMLVASGKADLEAERRSLDFLRSRRVDALVLHVEAMGDEEVLDLMQEDLPLVLVARHLAEAGSRSLSIDNEYGSRLATNHLIEHGHRRIGHLTGPLSFPDSRARLQGYRQALTEAGIEFDEALTIESDWLEEGGYHAARRLLNRCPDITAIFAGNDQMAAGVLQALRESGRGIPDDISVVGFDDVLFARYLYPSLTTVRQPLLEMGAAAARLVLAALNGEELEVKTKFEPELVVRQSVRSI